MNYEKGSSDDEDVANATDMLGPSSDDIVEHVKNVDTVTTLA